jgi:hypothetical protein
MDIKYQDGKIIVPKIEIYTNNTCNLNCNNCNRFNNHHFTGYQKWSDYKDTMRKWGDRILIDQIVIMGGEPLLNPTILDWIDGLNSIWPQSLQILSNGTRLNKVKGLYEKLRHKVSQHSSRNWIGISWHNTTDDGSMYEEIYKFLQEPIQVLGPETPVYGSETTFIDKNGVRIKLWLQNEFGRAAIHKNEQGNFTLWDNEPIAVHAGCGFAQFQCYHMIKGKLYKCGPVALFPEFDKQHGLDLLESDRELMLSYQPLTVDDFWGSGTTWFSMVDEPLPQCKFCPKGWEYDAEMIYPTVKNKAHIYQ